MKVVYLAHEAYPNTPSEIGRVVYRLAAMTQRAGNRVKVISYSVSEDSSYDRKRGRIMFKERTYQGVPVLAFRHEEVPPDAGYALEDGEVAAVAGDVIAAEDPDVVHVAHPIGMAEFIKVLQRRRTPYVVTVTDFFFIGPESRGDPKISLEFPVGAIRRRLQDTRQLLGGAAVVASASRVVAGVVEKEFPGLTIAVIPHGVPHSTLRKNGRRYAKRDQIVFCYVGSLERHRGVCVLIDAFRRLHASNVSLRIYGSASDDGFAEELRQMAGGDSRVEFWGRYSSDRMGDILGAADVMVAPSIWHESCPVVLQEALGCNLPVVGSDVGGIVEVIENGINGLVFKAGDPQHLASVLQQVVDDPPMLNTLKQNIDRQVIPRVEQEAYAYEDAYRRAYRQSGGGTMRPMADAAFRAEIEVLDRCASVPIGDRVDFKVRVKNTSSGRWRADGEYPVHLSYHWLDGNRVRFVVDGERTVLPFAMGPGAEVTVDCAVRAPHTPGQFLLEFDLVQERVAWFGDKGSPTTTVPCLVVGKHLEGCKDYAAMWRDHDLAQDYWSVVGPASRDEFERLSQQKLEMLTQLGLTPQSRVLDVGCGSGCLTQALAGFLNEEGAYWGTDVADEAVEFCQKKFRRPNFQFRRNELTRIPLEDVKFDFIVFFSVFTHTYPEETATLLKEAKRLLAEDGGLIVGDVFLAPMHERSVGDRSMVQISKDYFETLVGECGLTREVVGESGWDGPDGVIRRVLFKFRKIDGGAGRAPGARREVQG